MVGRAKGSEAPPADAAGGPGAGSLDDEQRLAVTHGGGPLLVLAGAGSGKTRVLTHRVVRLVQEAGVPPDRILAVTFTNKAADEMKDRIARRLGHEAAGLWIGTFHSICLRLLRRHGDRLGFRRGITVFDQDDSIAVLREILRARGGEAELPRVRQVQTAISAAKNRMWGPEDLQEQSRLPDRARLAALYREYEERLRAQDGADFDDLLLLAVRLLEEHPDLGDSYGRKFLHVLVDEFQDTNRIQLRLVQRFASGHGNVMVVGDDDQSIYRWRGADVTNILRFEEHFPGAHVVQLTRNYRSTGSILELATAVVAHNRDRRRKRLRTENPPGDRPVFYAASDEEAEARWVAGRVAAAARSGEAAYGDAAVLYRIHAQSRPIEEAFLDRGIPYVIIGGVAFYQRREIKDLLAYLRLALNPRDAVSFARAIAAPARGLGAVSLARLTSRAQARDGDLARTCAAYPKDEGLRGGALRAAHAFGALLEDLAGQVSSRGAGPSALLRDILERTRYLDWLRESGEPDWEDRRANVLELLAGAERFAAETEGADLRSYLDRIALYTNLDTKELGGDRVTLMTVHNAKGLEFPVVYLTGLEEGLFPHSSSLDDPQELEEERRLFYVGATRAMRLLCLSASLERRRMNVFSAGGLSRFVEEIPEEAIDRLEGDRAARAAGFGGFGSRGDPRRHPSFGRAAVRRGEAAERRRGARTGRAARSAREDGSELVAADPEDSHEPFEEKEATHPPAAGRAARGGRRAREWVGRNVRHRIFGPGWVEDQEGSGPDARLAVRFPQLGRKKILARFVELMEPVDNDPGKG